jgi:predicted CopG family antitoxin
MQQKVRLKNIAVSEDNYFKHQGLGKFGMSFNDVVTKLIQKRRNGKMTTAILEPKEKDKYEELGNDIFNTSTDREDKDNQT